ncbi:MAG: phytanoyl-CoA dioxygenase family protein [Spirulinaceae cyanobacterium]
MSAERYSQLIAKDGFCIIPQFLTKKQIETLKTALNLVIAQRKLPKYGLRRLLELVPEVQQICTSVAVHSLVASITGKKVIPIRSLFFDKNHQASWSVSWHQDLTIAVRKNIETPGFYPWSIKAGIPHVQPPIEILESIITLRFHLDNANWSNGCLQLMPGSHKHGLLNSEKMQKLKSTAINSPTSAGDILIMKPLLVHRSQTAKQPSHRRIIHIEFSSTQLPNNLQWYSKEF